MLSQMVGAWLEERLGAGRAVKGILDKPMAGGAGYIYSLGFLNLFLFINQMVTGIFLMMYYAPTPDHAYQAVKFIQDEASFGYMVRGLHFWGASAMIVSVLLHISRVFIYGAYKKPRELMWLSGTVMFLLVFGSAFTGYLLPWDQKAYWATVVGTNVAGTAPVVGGLVVRIMRGGADVSALTLTRFFALHTMVLPWTLAAFAGIHLTVLQLAGHGGPWDRSKPMKSVPFYPDQVFKDATLALFALALMMFLATVSPAGLEAVADPTDNAYNPRPEWYFYFLFQILRYFEGPYEVVGTMLLPNLFVVALLMLPFIDRDPERNPLKRPKAMAGLTLAAGGYIALTLLAVFAPPTGVSPAAGPEAKSVTEGRQLYASLGCGACHSINGAGGVAAPPLDHVGSIRDRDWLIGHFKDPQKYSPGSVMPGFGHLSEEELGMLTDYMQSLK
ncbi:MAG TPA: cytochrome b N-terminal domain-containing protein [Nitrospirota bacterium]